MKNDKEKQRTATEARREERPLDAAACYDNLLERALMAYEVANFREWDKAAAVYRYRNHAATHQAVRHIAYIFIHNVDGDARRETHPNQLDG